MKITFPKISLWHVLLAVTILAILTCWWFDRQIQNINAQINILNK